MTDVRERLKDLSEKDESNSTKKQSENEQKTNVEDRDKVQALVTPEVKDELEEVWQKIQAICSLSGRKPPFKNDYYSAVLLYGCKNMEQVAEHLDIVEEYEEQKQIIE